MNNKIIITPIHILYKQHFLKFYNERLELVQRFVVEDQCSLPSNLESQIQKMYRKVQNLKSQVNNYI